MPDPSARPSFLQKHIRVNTDLLKSFSFLDWLWAVGALLMMGVGLTLLYAFLSVATGVEARRLEKSEELDSDVVDRYEFYPDQPLAELDHIFEEKIDLPSTMVLTDEKEQVTFLPLVFPTSVAKLHESQPEGLLCNTNTPRMIYNILEYLICYGKTEQIKVHLIENSQNYTMECLQRAVQLADQQPDVEKSAAEFINNLLNEKARRIVSKIEYLNQIDISNLQVLPEATLRIAVGSISLSNFLLEKNFPIIQWIFNKYKPILDAKYKEFNEIKMDLSLLSFSIVLNDYKDVPILNFIQDHYEPKIGHVVFLGRRDNNKAIIDGPLVFVIKNNFEKALSYFVENFRAPIFLNQTNNQYLSADENPEAISLLFGSGLNHILNSQLRNKFFMKLAQNFFDCSVSNASFIADPQYSLIEMLYKLKQFRGSDKNFDCEVEFTSSEISKKLVASGAVKKKFTTSEIRAISFDENSSNKQDASNFIHLFNCEDSQRILEFITTFPKESTVFYDYIEHKDFEKYFSAHIIKSFLKNNKNIRKNYRQALEDKIKKTVVGDINNPVGAKTNLNKWFFCAALGVVSMYFIASYFRLQQQKNGVNGVDKKVKSSKNKKSRKPKNINQMMEPINCVNQWVEFFKSESSELFDFELNVHQMTLSVKGAGDFLQANGLFFSRNYIFDQLRLLAKLASDSPKINNEQLSIVFDITKNIEKIQASLIYQTMKSKESSLFHEAMKKIDEYEKNKGGFSLDDYNSLHEKVKSIMNGSHAALKDFNKVYKIFINTGDVEKKEKYESIYDQSYRENFNGVKNIYNQAAIYFNMKLAELKNLLGERDKIQHPKISDCPTHLNQVSDFLNELQGILNSYETKEKLNRDIIFLRNETDNYFYTFANNDVRASCTQMGVDFSKQCGSLCMASIKEEENKKNKVEQEDAVKQEDKEKDEFEEPENAIDLEKAEDDEVKNDEVKNEKPEVMEEPEQFDIENYTIIHESDFPAPQKDTRAQKIVINLLKNNQVEQLSVLRQYFQRFQAVLLFDREKNPALAEFIVPSILYAWFKFSHVLGEITNYLKKQNIDIQVLALFIQGGQYILVMRNFLRHLVRTGDFFKFLNDPEKTRELIEKFKESLPTIEYYVSQLEKSGKCQWNFQYGPLNFYLEDIMGQSRFNSYSRECVRTSAELCDTVCQTFKQLEMLRNHYNKNRDKQQVLLAQDVFSGAVKMMMILNASALRELKILEPEKYKAYVRGLPFYCVAGEGERRQSRLESYTHQYIAHGKNENIQVKDFSFLNTKTKQHELLALIEDINSDQVHHVINNAEQYQTCFNKVEWQDVSQIIIIELPPEDKIARGYENNNLFNNSNNADERGKKENNPFL